MWSIWYVARVLIGHPVKLVALTFYYYFHHHSYLLTVQLWKQLVQGCHPIRGSLWPNATLSGEMTQQARVWPKPKGRSTTALLSPVLWNEAFDIVWLLDRFVSLTALRNVISCGRWRKENVCSPWKLCCSSGAEVDRVAKYAAFWSCFFRNIMWLSDRLEQMRQGCAGF